VTSIFIVLARSFAVFLVLFMVVPWLGAWLMFRGFERAKLTGPTQKQCTQAYFFASSATLTVVFGLIFGLRALKSPVSESLVFLAAYVASQLLFVPLFLRFFSQRALLIQEGAIVLVNAVVLGLLYFFLATGGS
jgi:hypothetical protein